MLTAYQRARYPRQRGPWADTMPAEAAPEVDDGLDAARGVIIAVPAALRAWALIALCAVAGRFG